MKNVSLPVIITKAFSHTCPICGSAPQTHYTGGKDNTLLVRYQCDNPRCPIQPHGQYREYLTEAAFDWCSRMETAAVICTDDAGVSPSEIGKSSTATALYVAELIAAIDTGA